MKSLTRIALLLLCCTLLPVQPQTVIRKQFQAMSNTKLASIPNFVLQDIYKDRVAHPLPAAVDNSKKKYFPPYGWCIQGWSCSNATATSYCYDYEVQFLQDIATSGSTPLYTYEYTYHFLNSANQSEGGDGWMFVEAFDILKETGGATSADWGGFEYGNTTQAWMSGYQKYYNAMKVRAREYYKIDASVASSDELIKQYLCDHGDLSPNGGGILTFQANSSDMPTTTISGRRVFTRLGGGGGHALTICGYDDAFNGGCYLVCGNWGEGFYWAPYKLFRAGAGLATSQGTPVMCCRIKPNYSPRLTFKMTLTHSQRNQICIMTGMANSSTAAAPAKAKDYQGAFNYAGGANPMCGKGLSSTIEIGLDLTDLVKDITGSPVKFFLQVISKGGAGQVNSLTLMDYTGAAVKEFACAETNKNIASGATTTMSVLWNGTVAAADNRTPAIPVQKALRISPNPVCGGTAALHFTAPFACEKLVIRDIRGRTMAEKTLSTVDAKAMAWDLTAGSGRRIHAGVYIATIAGGGGGQTVSARFTVRE